MHTQTTSNIIYKTLLRTVIFRRDHGFSGQELNLLFIVCLFLGLKFFPHGKFTFAKIKLYEKQGRKTDDPKVQLIQEEEKLDRRPESLSFK